MIPANHCSADSMYASTACVCYCCSTAYAAYAQPVRRLHPNVHTAEMLAFAPGQSAVVSHIQDLRASRVCTVCRPVSHRTLGTPPLCLLAVSWCSHILPAQIKGCRPWRGGCFEGSGVLWLGTRCGLPVRRLAAPFRAVCFPGPLPHRGVAVQEGPVPEALHLSAAQLPLDVA